MPGALEHLRVVEVGVGVAPAHCGKLLRDMGAAVVKVEPPGGDPLRGWPPFLPNTPDAVRSGLFAYLNGGKQSVAFDLTHADGAAALGALLADADVLIDTWPAGAAPATLDAAGLAEHHPLLIRTSITAYGQTGPKSAWRGTDLTTHAASGMAMGTGGKVPDPNVTPPLRPGGRQADFVAGMTAATATLVAVHGRQASGRGALVDVSMQEALAAFTRMDVAFRTFDPDTAMFLGVVSRRGEPQRQHGLIPCKDGYFAFQATEQYQWEGFMRALGSPEWASRPEFQDPTERAARWPEIEPLLIASARRFTKLEIAEAAQAEHVPVFPNYTTAEALDDPQIRAREFFVSAGRKGAPTVVMPGAPVRHSATPALPPEPWPEIGAHTDAVLTPLLGTERLARLRADGVVR